ncbi:MAG: hypothetical protein ACE14S_12850 [Candidatus Bathyarchaeia archaeon]
MVQLRRLLLVPLLLCAVLSSLGGALGLPSSDFTLRGGEWYDSWNIDRNYYAGPDGYLPNMAYETLGDNRELAFSIGEAFASQYTSRNAMAEAILSYVQIWTEYGYDSDNVFRDGVAQEEWAWNADEFARFFNETTGVTATGDCEDMAFLLGTIYMGAGFDAAVVDASDHVGLLIWLPEYPNADYYWNIPDDGRGSGWIWVEATGESNPLGWTPPDFENQDWTAYPLGELQPVSGSPEQEPISIDQIILAAIAGVIVLALIAASAGRGSRRRV